jgi:hypothetical protein
VHEASPLLPFSSPVADEQSQLLLALQAITANNKYIFPNSVCVCVFVNCDEHMHALFARKLFALSSSAHLVVVRLLKKKKC